MDDLISRQVAIDALGDEPEVWTEKDEYEMGLNKQWHSDRDAIKAVPPAQPEVTEEAVKDYCRKRCLTILTNDHFHELTSAQPYSLDEWCTGCKEYDHEKQCCPRYNRVIRDAVKVRKKGKWITKSTNGEMFDCCSVCGYVEWDNPKNFCPNCGADMRGEEDGKNS